MHFADFDVDEKIILELIYGEFLPTGKLPIQLPSSMKSVLEQDEDVPFDLKNPLYDYGHGLSFWILNHFIFNILIYINEMIKTLNSND